jgi:DNA-binding PadR family transcriptional regulator
MPHFSGPFFARILRYRDALAGISGSIDEEGFFRKFRWRFGRFHHRDCMGRKYEGHGRRSGRDWSDWEPWSGFGGGGPRRRFFESGEVRLAILSLLEEAPKHGYQLIKELTERSGGMYRASAGTVYPTLQQLEDEGLIQAETLEGKKTYRITPDGARELEREHETVERIWKRAERWEDWGQSMGPDMFSFFRPLGSVIKATFHAAKWAGDDRERENKIRDILEQTRKELEELR